MNLLFQIDISYQIEELNRTENERWAIEALGWNDLLSIASARANTEKLRDFSIKGLKYAPFAEVVGKTEADNRYLIAINFVYENSKTQKTKKVKRQMLICANNDVEAKAMVKALYESALDVWEFQKVELSKITAIILKDAAMKELQKTAFEGIPSHMH